MLHSGSWLRKIESFSAMEVDENGGNARLKMKTGCDKSTVLSAIRQRLHRKFPNSWQGLTISLITIG